MLVGVAEEDGGDGVDDEADEGEGVWRDASKGEAVDDGLKEHGAGSAEGACPAVFMRGSGRGRWIGVQGGPARLVRGRWSAGGCGCSADGGHARGLADLVVDGGELEDFEFPLTVWSHDNRDIACLFADEAAADGRSGRDETFGHIGLLAGDELVVDLLVLGRVKNGDAGAEGHTIMRDVGKVDQG